MTTKGQILSGAFEPIGIADYTFDITPEEQASAFAHLDDMMAEWEADGIAFGYTAGGDDPNRSDVMTTPAWADGAIKKNLALRLAPGFGKTPSPDLKRDARRGYDLIRAKTLTIPPNRSGHVPIRGGGVPRWGARPADDIVVYPGS